MKKVTSYHLHQVLFKVTYRSKDGAGDHPAILCKGKNLVHRFYRTRGRAGVIMVRSKSLTLNGPHGAVCVTE